MKRWIGFSRAYNNIDIAHLLLSGLSVWLLYLSGWWREADDKLGYSLSYSRIINSSWWIQSFEERHQDGMIMMIYFIWVFTLFKLNKGWFSVPFIKKKKEQDRMIMMIYFTWAFTLFRLNKGWSSLPFIQKKE